MSFLKQLQDKKRTLNNTTTVITYQDGRRFVQQGNKLEKASEDASFGFVVDNKPDDTPAFVTDRIYLGSQDCCQLNVLLKHSIANVLSVGIQAPCIFDGFTYKHVPCLDLPETDLASVLNDCIGFIDGTDGNVLVHCNAGVSRSPSIIIGYLILKRNFTFDEAYSLVKSARPAVQPNVGFVKQLKLLTNYNN